MQTLVTNPQKIELTNHQPTMRAAVSTNYNLCDLFIYELSAILAGANKVMSTTVEIYYWLPIYQPALRETARELAENAREFLRDITDILDAENLNLSPTYNSAIEALVVAISPECHENIFEPWGVAGTRLISVFRKISLQMEAQTDEVAEYAFLLGSDTLHPKLRAWASKWADCASNLRMKKSSFCAEAYIADVATANVVHQVA